MEQGNFYVQFLDIAEEELKKNSTEIDLKNLQSLFDVALKTVSNSSTATSFHLDTLSHKPIKADNGENAMTEKDFVGESDEDFTDNLTCNLNTTNFISQLLQLLSINVCKKKKPIFLLRQALIVYLNSNRRITPTPPNTEQKPQSRCLPQVLKVIVIFHFKPDG